MRSLVIPAFLSFFFLTKGTPANSQKLPSPDSVISALYNLISGEAGDERDWASFRALFHPEAKLIPCFSREENVNQCKYLSVEEFITAASKNFEKEGFYEKEVRRSMNAYGNILHIFSQYETKIIKSDSDEITMDKGVNSIQLFWNGTSWKIVNIFWDSGKDIPKNLVVKKWKES